MAQFTLTEVQTYPEMSEETVACSAKLLLDGEIVGHVRNAGTGGGTYIRWNNREAREIWQKLLPGHPETLKRIAKGDKYPTEWAEERILDGAMDRIEAGGSNVVMEGAPEQPATP